MIKIDKIRKCMITALMAMSLLTVTACGAKKDMASNKAAENIEQSTETATVAKAKDMQMQVKDADGNTVTLTGDATINEAGEMVFEGKDSAGNVVKVTGTAEKTGDGSFKVKEAAVAGTAKVVADNGQETEVSNENKENVTVDEIKDTTTEVVKMIPLTISRNQVVRISERMIIQQMSQSQQKEIILAILQKHQLLIINRIMETTAVHLMPHHQHQSIRIHGIQSQLLYTMKQQVIIQMLL